MSIPFFSWLIFLIYLNVIIFISDILILSLGFLSIFWLRKISIALWISFWPWSSYVIMVLRYSLIDTLTFLLYSDLSSRNMGKRISKKEKDFTVRKVLRRQSKINWNSFHSLLFGWRHLVFIGK